VSWAAILVLAAGAYAFKAFGLIVIGSPTITRRLAPLTALIPAALFAAIIAVQTFESDESLVLDARVVGVAVAVLATWRRVPFVGVLALAMAATALVRAVA